MFDEDEYDEEEYGFERPDTPFWRTWRIIKKAIRIIALTIVFGTIGLLLLRMFSSGDPSSMKALAINDKLIAAYRENGELRALSQIENVITHENDDEEGYNYGYFTTTSSVFFPTADQVQIIFRYNDSTLRSLATDYNLNEEPDKNLDWYDVTLRVIIDRTPDNLNDNGETYWEDLDAVKILRIHPTDVISDTKPLYSYRRFTFDDVPSIEDETVLAVYVDVYYIGDIDYSRRPYGAMRIYTGGEDIHKFKLSGKDLRQLRELAE